MSEVGLRVLEGDDVLPVARLSGEIDTSNAKDLALVLASAVSNSAMALVVDLSEVTFLDSAGMRLLFDLAARLRRRQQELRLVLPPGSPLVRSLALTGLSAVVATYDTRAQATTWP